MCKVTTCSLDVSFLSIHVAITYSSRSKIFQNRDMFEISKMNIKFKQIPESEDYESLISQEGDKVKHFEAAPRNILRHIVTSVLFLVAFASTLLLGAWLGSHDFRDEVNRCVSRASKYCKTPPFTAALSD